MKADPLIIAAIERAFNEHPRDAMASLAEVQALAVSHGAEAVLSALAQLHLIAVTRLRFAHTPD